VKTEERFIIELAKALQTNGIPAHRLENTMGYICQHLKTNAHFYSIPHQVLISFPDKIGEQTYFIKTPNEDLNFERLEIIDKITKDVFKNSISVEQALNQLKDVEKSPQRYHKITNILFFALSTASAARLFGGGYAEIMVSGFIGLFIGVLIESIQYVPSLSRVIVLIASAFAIIITKLSTAFIGDFSVEIAAITGLIILIPGFSFTQAITELANGQTSSGTNRLVNATITFVMIAFGIGLGDALMRQMSVIPSIFMMPEIPVWTKYIALILVPAGFVVLFKAQPKHYIWMFIACLISFYSLSIFASFNTKELAVFFAAFSLGLASNIISRLTDRPVSLMLVPGIILLVPGSIGFKSVSYLVNAQTLSGIENAFSTVITAVALAAGLIFSNMIFKQKRAL
jgi:uncharacterized membrane protein YjjP (DUF1212 family)